MTPQYHYVTINTIGGRNAWLKLAEWTRESGVGEIEYHAGGWHDNVNGTVRAHIRFTRQEDALAYMLARGGDYSRNIPVL